VNDLDVIAATTGPGLLGSVIVGTVFAKTLASSLKKPFIAVNHLEAHALTCRLTEAVEFPYILFLLSGGHCQILIVDGVGDYRKIGETIDDSLGESFDKVAKMLDLGYPGGPKIEQLAMDGDQQRFSFPKPLIDHKNREQMEKMKFNFSFSGLKTAVKYELNRIRGRLALDGQSEISWQDRCDLCASFQRTVIEILLNRLQNVLNQDGIPGVLVIAGGVAANRTIARALGKVCGENGCRLVVPPPRLCTDNGLMVANAALERYRLGFIDSPGVAPLAKWELEVLKNNVYTKFS
jgi:N6-L-threonylcarbamoyladenine synthase